MDVIFISDDGNDSNGAKKAANHGECGIHDGIASFFSWTEGKWVHWWPIDPHEESSDDGDCHGDVSFLNLSMNKFPMQNSLNH